MDWIDLSQDREQWRALVNTVMNLMGSHRFLENNLHTVRYFLHVYIII
jgi:hypothetical protein